MQLHQVHHGPTQKAMKEARAAKRRKVDACSAEEMVVGRKGVMF